MPRTGRSLACCCIVVSILSCHGWSVPASGSDGDGSDGDDRTRPRIACVGFHGGVFPALQSCPTADQIELVYWTDEAIGARRVDPAGVRLVLIQHARDSIRGPLSELLLCAAKEEGARLISVSGLAEKHLPELVRRKLLRHDPQLSSYYGSTRENLDRLLKYIVVRYLGRAGEVPPPEPTDSRGKLYHPDHEELFETASEFLAWARQRGHGPSGDKGRVAIAVHQTHLVFQQPQVVDALIHALEQQGVLAVAVIDLGTSYESALHALAPHAVIHTCHSRDSVAFRSSLNVPHLHSIFMRSPSIGEWMADRTGLAAHDLAFQVTSQELLGAIEPLVGAGREQVEDTGEFLPIADRIDHIVRRAAAWCRLARTPNHDKKVAVIYYDREAGKGELMRGSATGMFLNAPRSLIKLLRRLRDSGYRIDDPPADEYALLDRLQDHGRLIGPWNRELLDPLARSGKAALIPVDQYVRWFMRHVPESARTEVVRHWGEPPGRFMVWRKGDTTYLVVPKVELGNIVLMPQPLRGEAFDQSKLHDHHIPPPHHYLAAYFWLQESFAADAVIHFGTHGSEFLLPGKPTGLCRSDWPDIVLGSMPNIQPWVINNLGESSPVRRRANAVLVDHLVPPSASAGLSDELANLHADIDKWWTLEPGALREAFRRKITDQFVAARLAADVGWKPLGPDKMLSDRQIRKLLEYLHELHNETIPTSLHVLGTPPPLEQQVPWIVTCLGKGFLEHLATYLPVPAAESLTPGDREKYLRRRAEEVVEQMVRNGFSPLDAIRAAGGESVAADRLDSTLRDKLELVGRLHRGFESAPREIEVIVEALSGKYVAPGPGNGPERNPSVLPTGRNMYVMNPQEVPSRPSWEIGVRLVDQLLEQHRRKHGRLPRRVAFSLNSFATFQDYGVMESQILYLLGVRPVWDANQRVAEVELIPRAELGRPRIDVFISVLGYYRDMLPTRMRLLDRAIRLAAGSDEPDNGVRRHSRSIAAALIEQGMPRQQAETLSHARIFGAPPGQFGSAGYYYLVERSGEWDSREQLVEAYLAFARYAYTEQAWGAAAPETYNLQIQGCDILLRSWSDRTRSPLSNKYMWYKGGSLSAAIRHLTGREPDWFLSDVRDPDAARLADAESALRKDFRTRLFNRKWIEAMMREGYAGADQIAVHVSNTYGWKIMRPSSVDDGTWNTIVDIYIRDTKNLRLRSWFNATNPYAFQEVSEILLEAARKGYWSPDESTRIEVARAYAESVIEHGEGGGLRGGGNRKLRAYVESILERAPGGPEQIAALRHAVRLTQRTSDDTSESSTSKGRAPSTVGRRGRRAVVSGRRLARQAPTREATWRIGRSWWWAAALLGALLLAGYRWGARR